MSGTLSIVALRALCLALQRAGVDPDVLLSELGVERTALADPHARLPADIAFRAFVRAPVLAGNEALSLSAAEALPYGGMEVLDFATASATSVGELLARVIRYYSLVDDRSSLTLERSGPTGRLVGHRDDPPSPRAATELLFGVIVTRIRQLTREPALLLEVRFRAEPPRDPSVHERFFAAPVRFGCRRNELVFDATWLEQDCKAVETRRPAPLERHATGGLVGSRDFLDRARCAVAEAIRGSDPSLERTAKKLAMGPRTLQRRLRERGMTHSELVAAVRRDLATALVRESDVSPGEIAYLLGFSQPSAFHRAFKRWMGCSPLAYRRAPPRGEKRRARA